MDLIFGPLMIGVFEGKGNVEGIGEARVKRSRRRAPRLEARRLPRRAPRRKSLGRSPLPPPVRRLVMRLRQLSLMIKKKGLLAGQPNEDGGQVGKEVAPRPNDGIPCRLMS